MANTLLPSKLRDRLYSKMLEMNPVADDASRTTMYEFASKMSEAIVGFLNEDVAVSVTAEFKTDPVIVTATALEDA